MPTKLRIFCFPSHLSKTATTGVDYARIISPMTHLNGYKGIETTLYKLGEKTNWKQVAETHDAIYFNYLSDPWGFAAMGSMARHFGLKLILDLDDAIWEIRNDNPAYPVWKKGEKNIKNFTMICNEVDYMTTTNDYLKHIIMNHTNKTPDKIKVFPNYVDLKTYKHRTKFKNDGQINLTHFGSTTHFRDLDDWEFTKGINRIMDEYPNVNLRTVGIWKPDMRERWGARYENLYGSPDIYKWISEKFPTFMDETDILITPLEEDIYNRGKSNIKWLESSSAKIPGVWQNIRQYAECVDGTNGILAKKDTEWYKGIKYLIDNPDKRQKMGEKAFEDVKKWEIDKHLEEYTQFFKEVVDKKIKV